MRTAATTSSARSRVTAGLMALVYAIVDAQSAGWGSAKTLVFFALAFVLLVGVRRRSSGALTAPLVRLSIFRIRSLLDRERGDVPRDVGDVRDVLLQHALHPAGARLRAAEGRSRVPAVHGGHHGLRRSRVAVRTADRRAHRRRDRDAPERGRPAAPDAAAGARLVRRRTSCRRSFSRRSGWAPCSCR